MSGPRRLFAKAGTRPSRPEAGGCPAWPRPGEGMSPPPCPSQDNSPHGPTCGGEVHWLHQTAVKVTPGEGQAEDGAGGGGQQPVTRLQGWDPGPSPPLAHSCPAHSQPPGGRLLLGGVRGDGGLLHAHTPLPRPCGRGLARGASPCSQAATGRPLLQLGTGSRPLPGTVLRKARRNLILEEQLTISSRQYLGN